jgi:hypothetical protein
MNGAASGALSKAQHSLRQASAALERALHKADILEAMYSPTPETLRSVLRVLYSPIDVTAEAIASKVGYINEALQLIEGVNPGASLGAGHVLVFFETCGFIPTPPLFPPESYLFTTPPSSSSMSRSSSMSSFASESQSSIPPPDSSGSEDVMSPQPQARGVKRGRNRQIHNVLYANGHWVQFFDIVMVHARNGTGWVPPVIDAYDSNRTITKGSLRGVSKGSRKLTEERYWMLAASKLALRW